MQASSQSSSWTICEASRKDSRGRRVDPKADSGCTAHSAAAGRKTHRDFGPARSNQLLTMPQLPDATSLGAGPIPRPGRGIASGPDRGAEFGAYGEVDKMLGGIREEIGRAKMDAQAVFAARRKLKRLGSARRLSDPWEKGAISRQGKRRVLSAGKELPAAFDKFTGEIGQGLTTKRQRVAFEQMVQSRREQVGAWADGHALKQREAHEYGRCRGRGRIKSFQDRAVLYSDNDKAIKRTESWALMNERTAGFLRGKGQSAEVVAQAVKENTTQAHMAVVAPEDQRRRQQRGFSLPDEVRRCDWSRCHAARSESSERGASEEGLPRSLVTGPKGMPLAERLAAARAKL